ncbi:MAG: hypothetical protein IJV22_01850 [Bacteroidales bacterium]|nr:hypothetical protein [Bacteroidales bacterium]
MQAITLPCPSCGASVAQTDSECEFCHSKIIITRLDEARSMSALQLKKYAASYTKTLAEQPDNAAVQQSVGLCYMQLRLFEKAQAAFERAIEQAPDNAEVYYCAAISQLQGKKPFLTPRANIDRAIEYLDAADMLEPRGIHHYLLAYIKKDYFERKYLNVSPAWHEELEQAYELGVREEEVRELFATIGVEPVMLG